MELSGGRVLDKKVDKIEALDGWRKPYIEEKQIIQGVLLDNVSGEKKTLRMVNFYSILFCLVGLAAAGKFFGFARIAIADKEYFSTVILSAIIIGCLAISYNFGKMFYIYMVEKPVKAFEEAIKQGHLRVLDVEIAEQIKSQNVRGNLDGHYVRVKDMQGTICNEILPITFVNSYEGKGAILIDVLLAVSEKAQKKITRTIVLPTRSASKQTWEKGLKLYQKYMK